MDKDLSPYIAELKTHLEDYLIKRVPGYKHGRNFTCLNPIHADKNPSMSFSSKYNNCHCFSCKATYDIIDLLSMEYNEKDFIKVLYRGCEEFGIYIPERQPHKEKKKFRNGPEYFRECHSRANQTTYFKKRGISKESIDRFGLGFDPNYPISKDHFVPVVIIPRGTAAYTARNTSPEAGKEDRYRKQGNARSTFFNIQALDDDEPTFIVEGEFDALSIIEAGFNAIALGSVDNYIGFVEICKEKDLTKPLFICLDKDLAGIKTSKLLLRELRALDISCEETSISLGFKDANEALINDREGFRSRLETVLREFKEKEIDKKNLDEIMKTIQLLDKEKWKVLGESIFSLAELPEEEQEKVFAYIKKISMEYKK